MPDNSKPGNLTGQSGGMADALDSKSCVRKGVWVRLPPLVLLFLRLHANEQPPSLSPRSQFSGFQIYLGA